MNKKSLIIVCSVIFSVFVFGMIYFTVHDNREVAQATHSAVPANSITNAESAAWIQSEIDRMGLSVEDAYNKIPHKQTTFEVEKSKLSESEKTGLASMFRLVDLGVVYRVKLLDEYRSGHFENDPEELYGTLLEQLKNVQGVDDKIHDEIYQSVVAQRDFFIGARSQRSLASTYSSDPNVQDSSNRLRNAYTLLIKTYDGEGSQNKDAFFQHLCALDFL